MDALARWIVRNPLLLILAFVAATAGSTVVATRIRIEGSLESVMRSDDPRIEDYLGVRRTFGSDEIAVVGVKTPDLFSQGTLEKIARVTSLLAQVKGVERVLSITNAVDPSADVFDPPPLLPPLPLSASQVSALRSKLANTPLYANNLVARDFDGVAINVFFENLTDAQYLDFAIDDKVQAILEAEGGPEQFFYTGAGHVKQEAVRLMRSDLQRFTPLAGLVVTAFLWLSFRRIRAVVLPLVSVLSAIVWTLAVMVLAGKSINLGTFVLPPLLLVIGSSYAMHVLARYYEQVATATTHDEAVVRAFQRVWAPLLISALTTAVGFGALITNRIIAIRDLGVFAVVGLLFLTVSTLIFLPAALLLRPPRGLQASPTSISPKLSNVLRRVGAYAYSSRNLVLTIAAVVGVIALLGARHIRVDSDFLANFDPSADVRIANETINREIVGSNPFFLVVEGASPGTLQRWDVLQKIKDLQAFVNEIPGVTATVSLVDYLELLEMGLNESDEQDLVIDEAGNVGSGEKPLSFWENPSALPPLISLVTSSPKTFRSVVNRDFSSANILVRTRLSGSGDIEAAIARIKRYLKLHFPAEIRVQPTGTLVLLTGTSSEIVAGQVKSLSLALAIIFIVMSLMFLSARVGLLAILPNALPILVFFGGLGWLGVDLNLGTSLIATIALGIAVDSTIHYMASLSRELKKHGDQALAMDLTMGSVGVPVLYTTLALIFGFLTFAGSSFLPIQNFGTMTAITLAAALVTNLVVLPALLATTKIITLWDLVSVRLGEDPGRTIPLLAGLRPAQARIVVLMGEMRSYAPDEFIVRQGDLGREMYVIIEGTAEVFAGTGSERRLVALQKRGDVFGEMGLVRHSERSADVVASSPVEVLAVDERFLQRIQRRYPRIASRVFLNLTRILSDRLQRMTDQFVAASHS